MKNPNRKTLMALGAITELGLNIVISFLLWILIASWVKNTFSLGNYVMIIGIFLGLGSAALSCIKFYRMVVEKERNDEKN